MAEQTKGNKRRQDGLAGVLGSSVDSPGSQKLAADTGQGDGTRTSVGGGKGGGGGTTQQTYYCSPPYFSSSVSSSSSSSSAGSPSAGYPGPVASEYPEYRGRGKSGSTGTPLTPQEFELLSDSNPFKQDIAEKYGIAYPGITTRAHSSEFIGRAEREGEAGLEDAEFGGARRKKRSASVNDSVDSFTLDISTWRASSEKISRMCKGLNAFLLRNQESIEQSIASLDDTDVVIPTSEGAGVFSAPKKFDIVYVGKQNSSEEINSPVHDISPERLLDAELNEIQLEGRRESMHSSDSRESLSSDPTAVPGAALVSTLPILHRPKQALEQTKSDPYSAIKSEDTQRKKTGNKIFAGNQSKRVDSEDDQLTFERLSTRSFEESSLVSQTSRDSASQKPQQSTGGPKPMYETAPSHRTSALSKENVDLLSFDDDDNSQNITSHRGDSKYGNNSTDVRGKGSEDDTLPSSSHSLPLQSQEPSHVKVKTIGNAHTAGSRFIDSGKGTHDPATGDKRKESTKTSSETSPPHEILATFDPFASVDKADKKSFDAAGSETQSVTTQGRGEKFSSSFYSVFSTTVSSLEDIDNTAEHKRAEKTDTSPEQHSSAWDTGNTTPSADSVFSAFSAGYERSVSESSQGRKESFGYFPGELLNQKKSKASEDSGESSKESVSRDSMRVNLSQDSSVADMQDEPTVLSHLQINGFPESEEIASYQPPGNTLPPRIEVGLPQRHLDLASMLLPMAESASTDSMFVHVSTDSLHSATSGRSAESHEPESGDQRKLSDKSSRAQLSIDLRRKNLMEQNRRRSLPLSQLKNVEQAKRQPPALYASQSLDSTDTPEHPLQRRSSVPSSRPKPDASRTLQRIGSTSAPKLQYRVPESDSESSQAPAEAQKPRTAENNPGPGDVVQLAPTSPPQAISPSTARPRPSSKRGSVSSEKGAPVSINLAQVVNILAGTTVSTTQPTTTKVKVQKPQRTKIQFTIAAKAPEPSTGVKPSSPATKPQFGAISPSFSPGSQTKTIPLSQQPKTDQGVDGTGFLHERKEEMSNVNAMQPPDLVPYEETFTSQLSTLSERSQSAAEEKTEAQDSKIEITTTDNIDGPEPSAGEADAREAGGNESKSISDATEETKVPADGQSKKQDCPAVTASLTADQDESGKRPSRNSIVKSSSGSDSDGGDIDTIVQEFKEDISEEGDIDDLVKEFIEEHPEAATAATPPTEPELTRQPSLGFNKIGRVLNKMQSVTKYMSKKKTLEEAQKSPTARMKLGRRSRTTSQNENDELSSEVTAGSSQPSKGDQGQGNEDSAATKEETDPFELLSKAAEVFKAQTINKKRSPSHRAARVWRSMTIEPDVAELENNEDCDLVTRAAVLFKGFKGRRALREDGPSPTPGRKAETETPEDGRSKDEVVPETSEGGTGKEGNESNACNPSDTEMFPSVAEESENKADEKDEVPSCKANDVGSPTDVANLGSPQDDGEASARDDKPSETGIDTDTNTEMEESLSKMDDSGFESCIRYAAENSVKSDDDEDDTDGPGKVNNLLDSAREHAVFSVVEVTSPEINTYENITCKLGASIHDFVEKSMLTSIEKTAVYERPKQDIVNGDGVILNEVEWPETKSKKIDPVEIVVKTEDGLIESKDNKLMASNIGDDYSAATDSGLDTEPKSEKIEPEASRPVSTTCDLILSTGYDDTKHTKVQHSDSSEHVEGAAPVDAREKTNGKLDELTKEILAVEAASFDPVAKISEENKLKIQPPEYQRMSSDSSENPDSNSLTVNLPDSPENGMSLAGDGAFSLCCGANFKINLNCTAMVKKPERRPSKVVIENKRCAMTEEEKAFPMKVSSSFRDNFDKDQPPEGDGGEMSGTDQGATASSAPKTRENTLKVNEHERNRNFAGSREELLDQKNRSQPKDSGKQSSVKEQKDEDAECKASQIETKQQKRRSIVEDFEKDKAVVDNYETVIDELSKKQSGVPEESNSQEGKVSSVTEAQELKQRAKAKRYGRVISESEFDDGLLPSQPSEANQPQRDADTGDCGDIRTVDNLEAKAKKEEEQKQGHAVEVTDDPRTCEAGPGQDTVVTSEPMVQACLSIQQSMDVYDNIKLADVEMSKSRTDGPPPLPVRDPRRYRHYNSTGNSQNASRYQTPAGSVTSVVSDGGGREGVRADVYLKARRAHNVQPQGKTKWVSSTPHLPTTERRGDIPVHPQQGNRHSSFPRLHAGSDSDVSAPPGHQYNYTYKTHHRGHSEGSASSFDSESICWGNYARVADLQLQERGAILRRL